MSKKQKQKKKKNQTLVIVFLMSCIIFVGLMIAIMFQEGKKEHEREESSQEDKTDKAIEATTALPQTLDKDNPDRIYYEDGFYYEPISEVIWDRIHGKSFGEDCTVDIDDLRYVRVLYIDLDGAIAEGELIVNKQVAQDVVEIFKELYDQKYPIEKIRLIDDYNANDEKSMADNNTSAFNFRMIEGTTTVSDHSFGLAIDINPLYNPCIQKMGNKTTIMPKEGEVYADRSLEFDYKIRKGDVCYQTFISHGWKWGGEWEGTVDYQHFYKDLQKE